MMVKLFVFVTCHLHQSFADKVNYPMEAAARTMPLDCYHLLLLHDAKKCISPDLVHVQCVYAIGLRAIITNVRGLFVIVVTFPRSAVKCM